VLTGLALVAGFLAALFGLPGAAWVVLVALIVAFGAWEWAGLAKFGTLSRASYAAGTAGACLALSAATFGWPPAAHATTSDWLSLVYGVGIVFWGLLVPYSLVRHVPLGAGPFAILVGWLVLLPGSQAMIHLRGISPLLLLAAMSLVWVADIAAYFVGRAYGRHKLAPTVSPGKTWEGALGALSAVLCCGLAYVALSGDEAISVKRAVLVVVGLVLLTAVSIVGDLFESLVKRQAGVKDSGRMLPGHGGVLDRIDSLTSTLPLFGLAMVLWSQ
jgi:phosphatidate cytidylyltransferase